MPGINQTLFTAKEALLANLTAINLTGANIANVNTPGYTRLRPVFESAGTTNVTSTLDQAGVKIAGVERIYDRFLEAKIVASASAVGNYAVQKDMLSYVEGILNETAGTGINDALSRFWNAWSSLSANPSGDTQRELVVSAAQNVAAVFSQRFEELQRYSEDANGYLAESVTTLNGYLSEMASLNHAVVQTQSAGGNTSSLCDTRNELLNKISGIIDVDYMEKPDGSLYLYQPATGKIMVDGEDARFLQVQRNSANQDLYDIAFQDDPSQVINTRIGGGKLAALLAIRDGALPACMDALNQTALSLINSVNDRHTQGYDKNGNPGGVFFRPSAGAKSMAVDDRIVADVSGIAASSGLYADGNNADSIAALRDRPMSASLGTLVLSNPASSASGVIDQAGDAYKSTIDGHALTLARGAGAADWTIADNGGYVRARILTADASSVTVDLNGNGTAAITLTLSGAWSDGDTLAVTLTQKEGAATLEGYYNSFIARVGQSVVDAAQSLAAQNTLANQLSQRREALSGVSLDEEMMNLIKFQMAYNAAGRMTQAVSEIMDLLMSLGE
jgi:flagellar hook-associated protein 1 FlgK